MRLYGAGSIATPARVVLAVLILAEIFRAGADLQDDQALTV